MSPSHNIYLKLPQNITIIIQATLALYFHSLIHSYSSYISLEKNVQETQLHQEKNMTWVTHAAKIVRNPLTAIKLLTQKHKGGWKHFFL